MKDIDIVDRLTNQIDFVGSLPRRNGDDYLMDSMLPLMVEARNRIHELQGMVYAYPPWQSHQGITWREEYDSLISRMQKMSIDEFSQWRIAMQKDS